MRMRGLLLMASLLVIPAAAQAFEVDTGGPYQVDEGGQVELTVVVEDFVGEVHYAWDLDANGIFDDGDEATVTFSAVGLEPGWVTVSLVVSIDVGQQLVSIDILIGNENELPEIRNAYNPRAVVGRLWSWTPDVVDTEGDPFELTVDEDDLPFGMLFDGQTLTWVPDRDHLQRGNPPGHYEFEVGVEAEHIHFGVLVSLDVVENQPPPTPRLAYPSPASLEPVRATRPTIILENVEDPEGDDVTYWVSVDADICFCSPEMMQSGPIPEGNLATQWHMPRPLDVEPGVERRFYLRRWATDGFVESDSATSLFSVLVSSDGGDGDADADADADVDSDADLDADADGDADGGHPAKEWERGCFCDLTALGPGEPNAAAMTVTVLLAGLLFVRRRP